MRYILFFLITSVFSISTVQSQDTFSIVAVDSVTGEVGSAGASCVDLFQFGGITDHFLGQLIPGVGAINTQAYYDTGNQNNATARMNLGETPSQIIQWLTSNDVAGNPTVRQYGISAMINGSPQSAAHTGTSTDDYKNHIVGPNYSIQGNILLGQQVLDSMEARFLAEEGDLACKLMAALQGANMVGADTRCATNGTSSLFAYVKVAQTTDTFGNPSFIASVRTHDGDGIEPIDSLQLKFDLVHPCGSADLNELNQGILEIFPNPTKGKFEIRLNESSGKEATLKIHSFDGSLILEETFTDFTSIDLTKFESSLFLLIVEAEGEKITRRVIKN
ncbi:MAG: secretion protein [Fluviicola sp.]|nr:MAG: secretion protein [Fluviicola sp.]